jgi:hypothetical protein
MTVQIPLEFVDSRHLHYTGQAKKPVLFYFGDWPAAEYFPAAVGVHCTPCLTPPYGQGLCFAPSLRLGLPISVRSAPS